MVNSNDAVISDEALAALLDRTLKIKSDPSFKEKEEEEDSLKSACSVAHTGIFKVIAERDCSGTLIGGEDTAEGGSPQEEQITEGKTGIPHATGEAMEQDSSGHIESGVKQSAGKTAPVIQAAAADTTTSPSPSASPEPTSNSSLGSSSSASISSASSASTSESMDVDSVGGVVVANTTVSISEEGGERERDVSAVLSPVALASK